MSISTTLLFSVVACGGNVDPTPTTGTKVPGSPEKTEAPSATPSPSSTVSVSGTTLALDGSPVAGVNVCERVSTGSSMTCTTSAEDGKWTLSEVPGNEMVTVSFEKLGFMPTLRAVQTEEADIALPSDHAGLLPVGQASAVMGGSLDVKQGQIAFFATGADDVTVTATSLDGTSGKPTFVDQAGRIAAGATQGASGFFENLTSGYYVLTFHSASGSCTADSFAGFNAWAYPAAGEAQVIAPVEDGYVTAPIAVLCTPQGTTL